MSSSEKQSFFIFPPSVVSNVPTFIAYHQNGAGESVYSVPEESIISCKWYIDDELVHPLVNNDQEQQQQKDHKKPSFLKSIFSPSKTDSHKEIKLNEFTPKSIHAGKKLRVVADIKSIKNGPTKSSIELISDGIIRTHPKRSLYKFSHEQQQDEEEKDDINDFSIITYNIMADCYTQAFRYKTPPYALYRPYRKHLMGKYILDYSSDIVCLQEFEPSFKELIQEMEDNGYSTTPVIVKDGKRYQPPDQCITFIRKSKFTVLKQDIIDFNMIGESSFTLLSDEQIKSFDLNPVTKALLQSVKQTGHHNRFSLVHLKDIQTQKELLVVNVHLYWGAPTDDQNYKLQLIQFYIITLILKNIKDQSGGKDIPIILCGDLNNEPHHATNTFIRDGVYNVNHEKDIFTFKHSFKFTSVYSNHPFTGETSFTTVTKSYQKCIDFIYTTNNDFKIKSWLEVGDHYQEQLPSIVEPSDHILLKANLNLK